MCALCKRPSRATRVPHPLPSPTCSYYQFFHLLDVLFFFAPLLYFNFVIVLSFPLSSSFVLNHHNSTSSFQTPCLPSSVHLPFPCPSMCSSLNNLSPFLLCFSKNLNSKPPCRIHFLSALLLLLSGDINLNPGPTFQFAHLNIRSASSITHELNKPAVLQEFISDHNIEVLSLCETWLSPDTPLPTLNSLTPPNFSIIHFPRPD